MPWHQFSVTTNEAGAPELADFFSELGAVSVTYMDAEDRPVYEPLPGETKIWPNTKVIALFERQADPERVAGLISTRFNDRPLRDWSAEIIEDQAWERSWMEHFKPMPFGRLWVCPTGQEVREPGSICLILDPGLAFGTGTHPTTALCLEWLAEQELHGKTVLDYGCGSGILAVAAVLLGARNAYAVDIDPQALTATQDNARKNHVTERIECYLPEQLPAVSADVVMANILAQPLIDLAAPLSARVAAGGRLLLSGILSEQTTAVAQAYRPAFQLHPPVIREDWCRLDGHKVS